jgi:hypothetical protein
MRTARGRDTYHERARDRRCPANARCPVVRGR